jgi:hypothetical protein
VTYLNGSKVLTSGSALTFDGTTLTSNAGFSTGIASGGSYKLNYASNVDSRTWRLINDQNVFGDFAIQQSTTQTGTTYRAVYSALNDGTQFWSVAGSEQMRLNSTGLGIGTSSPSQRLSVSGNANFIGTGVTAVTSPTVYFSNTTASTGRIYGLNSTDGGSFQIFDASAGNATRVTLTSGGDLLVGTTSSSIGQSGIIVTPAYNAANSAGIAIQHANGSLSGNTYLGFTYNAVDIGSVTQNGTTAVLYNTTSDRRLKDNIVPAPSASDVIDAIQIVSHDWKSAPGEHVKYGVVAQDLHAVAPQAVKKGDDGEDIVETWGVDYSKLVPMLIKEIQSLRARVAALEA